MAEGGSSNNREDERRNHPLGFSGCWKLLFAKYYGMNALWKVLYHEQFKTLSKKEHTGQWRIQDFP